jgi:hypothetical protein
MVRRRFSAWSTTMQVSGTPRVSECASAGAAADDDHVIVLSHQSIVGAPGGLGIIR